MKKFLVTGLASAALVAPLMAFAATDLGSILLVIGDLIAFATPIIVALALLAFFWGLAMYIFNVGNEEQRKKGLQIMIWGIIALFVMVSIWGIVQTLQNTFGVGTGTVLIPSVDY